MIPIEFKEQNIIIAEKQDEYQNIPAFVQQAMITFCNTVTDEELIEIEKFELIEITVLSFNSLPQPIALRVVKPELPVDHKKLKLNCNPVRFDEKEQTATFSFELSKMDLNVLKRNKELWITIVTYNNKLLPIRL